MDGKQNHYQELERYLTFGLIADAIIFVLYLIVAGNGIIWLKVITAFLALALSSGVIYFLYTSKELLRQRSLWITVGAASVFLCTLMSLILNYPSPGI